MTMEPRQIEALQQAFTSMPAGVRGGDCPEPERLWAAVCLELPAKERRQIVQHVAVCAACAEDWRVTWKLCQAQRSADDGDPNGEVISGPWTRFRNTFPQVAAAAPQLAAAALVVLAVGVTGWSFHHASETQFRAETVPTAGESAESRIQLLVPEGATLPVDQVVLKWAGGPQDCQYEVKVTSPEGDTLYTASSLTTTSVTVPAKELESVSSGNEIYWQVQWFGVEGTSGPIFGPRSVRVRR